MKKFISILVLLLVLSGCSVDRTLRTIECTRQGEDFIYLPDKEEEIKSTFETDIVYELDGDAIIKYSEKEKFKKVDGLSLKDYERSRRYSNPTISEDDEYFYSDIKLDLGERPKGWRGILIPTQRKFSQSVLGRLCEDSVNEN